MYPVLYTQDTIPPLRTSCTRNQFIACISTTTPPMTNPSTVLETARRNLHSGSTPKPKGALETKIWESTPSDRRLYCQK